MAFKNGVKSIKTEGYNGAHTVYGLETSNNKFKMYSVSKECRCFKCELKNNGTQISWIFQNFSAQVYKNWHFSHLKYFANSMPAAWNLQKKTTSHSRSEQFSKQNTIFWQGSGCLTCFVFNLWILTLLKSSAVSRRHDNKKIGVYNRISDNY